jgi:hypothetical protein
VLQFTLSFRQRLIAIFVFTLLPAASALAQSQSISGYSIYNDRASWVKAVVDAGITPPIGTQTFENISPALYFCINDPGGLVTYSSGFDCQVSVAELNDFRFHHVLRPNLAGVGISAANSRAIAFDVVGIEAGQGCSSVQVLTNISGNGISFSAPASGFVGIIAPPDRSHFQIVVQPLDCLGILLVDNVSYPGGPDDTNPPVPCPDGAPSGTFCFTPPVAIGPAWYDPPATEAFDFSSPDAKFLSINDFPSGFSSPFIVSTGGTVLGSFSPGQSVQFPNGGVHEFRISGISPTVDGGNPYSFPINLSLDKVGVVFTMTPAAPPTCDAITWHGFSATSNYAVQQGAVPVTSGDFNGDGRLDLAVGNADVASVSILLGNGSGGFGSATNFAVGAAPYGLATGDFNGDGKLDLAIAGRGANSVVVLLGNGTGNFGVPTCFAVGTKPQSVAVGDFNSDGKLDIAAANFGSNNVSVLLGNGTGGFSAATNFAVGNTPFAVATADFNNDGKFDLALANHNSNNVSVLLGDGSGSFAAATNFAVGGNANSVTVGDFNGDGKKDLAVPNSSNVSVLLGDGAGGFSAATNFGAGAVSVSVNDFDGDGRSDLAAVNFSSNSVSVLLGNGTGGFATPTNFDVGSGPESIVAGDFNGDAIMDVAVPNSNSDNASVLLNNGSTCGTPIDSTPPTLVLPSNITTEATGPSGAAVSYIASASDNMDPHPSMSCSPASGSTFALGTNLVQCTATDATGNHASRSFSVTVIDTTPPALTLPQNMTLDSTSPQGALVNFTVAASDIADLHPSISCTPASGSTFAIQTTVVHCVATDASRNSSQGSFSVTINGASTQTANLIGLVQSFNLAQGITNSLDSKLQNILDAFSATNAGDRGNACNQLSAFINSVLAQSGKQLTTAQANQLIAKANQIRAVEGCL